MASKNGQKKKRNVLPKVPQIDEIVINYLDQLCDGAFKRKERVPGVAVAVRSNKNIVHINCYGYANLETGTKIKPDTVFDLGSLSKQFTAAAIYNLVIHSQLDINEPLSKFFFELPRWSKSITVEDLLHHTSALPEYVDIFEKLKPRAKGLVRQGLEQARPLVSRDAGSEEEKKLRTGTCCNGWRQRNDCPLQTLNTDIQIQVMSYSQNWWREIAQQRFAEYVMETVILGIDEEVQMRKTYVFDEINRFHPDDPETAYHAKCYNRVKGRFVPVGYTPLNFIKGDGNVHSTIRDLAMWEKFLHTLDYHLPARELLWSPVLINRRSRLCALSNETHGRPPAAALTR